MTAKARLVHVLVLAILPITLMDGHAEAQAVKRFPIDGKKEPLAAALKRVEGLWPDSDPTFRRIELVDPAKKITIIKWDEKLNESQAIITGQELRQSLILLKGLLLEEALQKKVDKGDKDGKVALLMLQKEGTPENIKKALKVYRGEQAARPVPVK